MVKREFGGDWTTDKLERLRKYLCAYMTIFKNNPRARYFTTVYVDAFAGSGYRVASAEPDGAPDADFHGADPEAESFKKGSARIALEVEPSFDRFVFIERDSNRVKDLRVLRQHFPGNARDVEIAQGDANPLLRQWCEQTDWNRHRAVVFLDPFGMQVEWSTLEGIAQTKAIDLWLLFPLGVAVNRLLTKDGPPPGVWARALSRIFGTKDWEQAFYPKREEQTLFGPEEMQTKEADLTTIGRFFLDRLKTVFVEVAANPLPLRNSTNIPIYLLCFAAGNPKSAKLAVRIAQDILKR